MGEVAISHDRGIGMDVGQWGGRGSVPTSAARSAGGGEGTNI